MAESCRTRSVPARQPRVTSRNAPPSLGRRQKDLATLLPERLAHLRHSLLRELSHLLGSRRDGRREPRPQRGEAGRGLVDRLDAELPQSFEAVLHGLQLFGRVPLPIRDLAGDAQRLASPVGFRRIAGEFLVGQIRIIDDRAGRLDGVDPARSVAGGQLGAQMAASRVPVR